MIRKRLFMLIYSIVYASALIVLFAFLKYGDHTVKYVYELSLTGESTAELIKNNHDRLSRIVDFLKKDNSILYIYRFGSIGSSNVSYNDGGKQVFKKVSRYTGIDREISKDIVYIMDDLMFSCVEDTGESIEFAYLNGATRQSVVYVYDSRNFNYNDSSLKSVGGGWYLSEYPNAPE